VSLIIIFSTLSFPLIIMIMIASFLYQLIAKFTAYQAYSTRTHLTALCPGASTRKVKPIWILLKQETVSGSGISWAVCKSAPRSRQITTPALHHSVFYRRDALPAAQPTASKHRRLAAVAAYCCRYSMVSVSVCVDTAVSCAKRLNQLRCCFRYGLGWA